MTYKVTIPKNQKWRIAPSRIHGGGIMPRVFDLFMPELYMPWLQKPGHTTLAGRYMGIHEAMNVVCRAELYSELHYRPGEIIGSARTHVPGPTHEPDIILYRS